MGYLIAFHAFTFFEVTLVRTAFWDIQSLSSWNQFPPHPMDKISFVHPTYTPMGLYIYKLEWIIWLHFMTLHCFWGDGGAKPAFWDIQSVSSWNGFSTSPINKISFVHPIYTPMGPYLSIGMGYLISFHAFTFFEVMVVRNQRFGTFSPFRLKTNSPPVQLTK